MSSRHLPPLADNPFLGVHYFSGQILGVDDLALEQGYHRGKGRLHTARVHGAGVVWGLRVGLRPEEGGLVVQPGLGVDGAGQEMHIEREAFVDLTTWWNDGAPAELEQTENGDGTAGFVAHVTIAARHDLSDPVVIETDGEENTEFSRIREGACLDVVLGPAPAPGAPYPRLRMLLGLLPTADPEVAAAREELQALPAAERPAVLARWFRALAAEDVMDLPGVPGDVCMVLAEVHFRVRLSDRSLVLRGDAVRVDNRVRPSHVSVAALADLLCGLGPAL